ncbi:porin [Thiopseudomonas alkaliphila]|uniref:OprO/OprP family phosphate-selective porin n=1 Tax=Thiopseudomonas alkaliphila TaxID=1697053 RepID=UPI00069DFB1F|nr:porin [Thiopseudomonas alkaliphila]AKX45426.1 porin [Thiopseudomonas alkaliphila]
MFRFAHCRLPLSLLTLAIVSPLYAGTVSTDGVDLVIKTKGGFEVKTVDDAFSFQLGGRLQLDMDSFNGVMTKNGKRADEAYLRRARLEASGKVYSVWGYDFSVSFADDGETSWKEASISYLGLDPVTLKFGRFDPDFGLESATSSKWITAIERSMIYDLAPWVNDHQEGMGLQISASNQVLYGSASVNRPKNQEDTNGKNKNNYGLRVVYAPFASAGNVLHFGASYANSQGNEFDGRIRTRLGVRGTSEDSANGNRLELAPKIKNANFDSDRAWGLELAWAHGPLSLQGEYLRRDLKADNSNKVKRNDRKADGYYGQIAYTLTGESRGYKLDGGKFDKIKPNDKSLGAWEVFYRHDQIKVKESDFLDNKVKGHTFGVNWYANEAVKISANYVKVKTSEPSNKVGDKTGDALSLRAQYVF